MKDKFEKLEDTVKDKITALGSDEVKTYMVKTISEQSALMAARDVDSDWLSKKEAYKVANEVYSSGTKENKLKVAFALQTLISRGVKV